MAIAAILLFYWIRMKVVQQQTCLTLGKSMVRPIRPVSCWTRPSCPTVVTCRRRQLLWLPGCCSRRFLTFILSSPRRLCRECLLTCVLRGCGLWLAEIAFFSTSHLLILICLAYRTWCTPSCSGLCGVNSSHCSLETADRLILRTPRSYFRAIMHKCRLFSHWQFSPSFSTSVIWSAIIQSCIFSAIDLTKDDITDDPEWLLKVISGTINGFISMYQIHSVYNVRSQLQRSDIICAIFSTVVLEGLLWWRERPVSDC